MNEKLFIETIMMKIDAFMSPSRLDDFDRGLFESDLKRMYKRGFTVQDALSLCLSHEEVNPDLPEDIAIENMKRIEARYSSS